MDKKGEKFREVMKEFREGKLRLSSGEKVTERAQAMAIAMKKIKEMEKSR